MTFQSVTGPESAIEHRPVGDVSHMPEADRGEGVGGCVPRRFYSAGEATRDLLDVLRRGHLLAGAYAGGLDRRLRERVMVAVSQVNACSECARVHRRWARRAGVSLAELEALRVGDLERLDPRSRAAVSYAVGRAESRFAEPLAGVAEGSAREHLSAQELGQVDARSSSDVSGEPFSEHFDRRRPSRRPQHEEGTGQCHLTRASASRWI